jgi:hypothetical protein
MTGEDIDSDGVTYTGVLVQWTNDINQPRQNSRRFDNLTRALKFTRALDNLAYIIHWNGNIERITAP